MTVINYILHLPVHCDDKSDASRMEALLEASETTRSIVAWHDHSDIGGEWILQFNKPTLDEV